MIVNVISNELRRIADKIDTGECALTEDECLELLSHIAHQKLNKTEAADLLGISTRTFDRKIDEGIYPQGQKVRGQNTLIWYKDELLK